VRAYAGRAALFLGSSAVPVGGIMIV
jgi:hypothetical protein